MKNIKVFIIYRYYLNEVYKSIKCKTLLLGTCSIYMFVLYIDVTQGNMTTIIIHIV